MSDAFTDADAVVFDTFGVAATYKAGGVGAGTAVTVVRSRATADTVAFGTALRVGSQIISVRVSEAPDLAKGDTFTIGAEVLTVGGKPALDALATMWTAEC